MADLMDEPDMVKAGSQLSHEQINTEVETIRTELTDVIKRCQKLEGMVLPPFVQELVLARRDAENSRMRFGVGQAYFKGFDPWENKVTEKSQAGTK